MIISGLHLESYLHRSEGKAIGDQEPNPLVIA
jgi:hypothetical protein